MKSRKAVGVLVALWLLAALASMVGFGLALYVLFRLAVTL